MDLSLEPLPLDALYNLLVDDAVVLVDTRPEPVWVAVGDTSAIKRRVNGNARTGAVCSHLVVVGDANAALPWLRDNHSWGLKACVLAASADEVVARYPWLASAPRSAMAGSTAALLASEAAQRSSVAKEAGALLKAFPWIAKDALELPHRIGDTGLFLGSFSAAKSPWLPALGIGAVVNVANMEYRSAHGFEMLTIKAIDMPGQDLSSFFDQSNAFIDAALARGSKVLVHCAAGVSRSTTLLLAFLIARRNMSLKDAYLLTRSHRRVVQPNSGFVQQLIAYELRVRGANSVHPPPFDHSNSWSAFCATSLAHLCLMDGAE